MNDWKADSETLDQLSALGYLEDGSGERGDKPLLICDVDEVVLHLVDPFVRVMSERGYELRSHSFQLTGNVYHAETGREATREEVHGGLAQLFNEQEQRQELVEGAVEGLNRLAEEIDVLFLTNMPHAFRDTRIGHLVGNGLDHPLVTNTGSKVPAIRIIETHRDHEVGFIDDTPKNLNHVREGAPDVHLFHFMANGKFRELAGEIDGTHISSGDWKETGAKIREVLTSSTKN